VKFAEPRPFSDPEAAVRKLIEIANAAEPVQDARIYIERVNGPFLAAGGSPAEYRAGIERAIAKGWLSGTNPGPTSNSPTPAPSYSPDGSDGLEASLRRSDPAARRPPARHP
jgi:hypothetical protein